MPGGFGKRGIEGIIQAIGYARVNKIPYLGLCYGMQLAAIEFARNVLKLKGSNSTEVNEKTKHPIIYTLPGQEDNIAQKKYGGTLRLGAYPCLLKKGTKAAKAYGDDTLILERHRHRYEFNSYYRDDFEKNGMLVSGTSPDDNLVEIIELDKHPFFIGVQFHPEFKSSYLKSHPLFFDFIHTMKNSKK